METSEDEQWVRAAQGGDEAAFGRLIDRYKDTVFATVVAITGDFDAAHDIAQETFLRAWFGIARNRSRTFLERRQRQPARESIDVDELAHSGRSPEQDAERSERRQLCTMPWTACRS